MAGAEKFKENVSMLIEQSESLVETHSRIEEEHGTLKETLQMLIEQSESLVETHSRIEEKHGTLKEPLQMLIEQFESLVETQSRLEEEHGTRKETASWVPAAEKAKAKKYLSLINFQLDTLVKLKQNLESEPYTLVVQEELRLELKGMAVIGRVSFLGIRTMFLENAADIKKIKLSSGRRVEKQRKLNALNKLNEKYDEFAKKPLLYYASEFKKYLQKINSASKELKEQEKIQWLKEWKCAVRNFSALREKYEFATFDNPEAKFLKDARFIEVLKASTVNYENFSRIFDENNKIENENMALTEKKNVLKQEIMEMHEFTQRFNDEYEQLEKIASSLPSKANAEEKLTLRKRIQDAEKISEKQEKAFIEIERVENQISENNSKYKINFQTLIKSIDEVFAEAMKLNRQRQDEINVKLVKLEDLRRQKIFAEKDVWDTLDIRHKKVVAFEAEKTRKIAKMTRKLELKMQEYQRIVKRGQELDAGRHMRYIIMNRAKHAIKNEVDALNLDAVSSAWLVADREKKARDEYVELRIRHNIEKKNREVFLSILSESIKKLEKKLSMYTSVIRP